MVMDDNSEINIPKLKEIGDLFLSNGFDFITTSGWFFQAGVKGRYYIIDSLRLEETIIKVQGEWNPKFMFIMPGATDYEVCLFSVHDFTEGEIKRMLDLKVFL